MVNRKADYVKSQRQTRDHECHGGCGKQVPPAKWGCSKCWFSLPRSIRNKIWSAYQPGQEVTMQVSKEYLDAAREAQQYVDAHPERFRG